MPDETPDEVEVVDGEVVYAMVPWTGEALQIKDMAADDIAAYLELTRQFEQTELRAFKRALQDEVLARMDREASWTIHVEGYKLSGDAPGRVEYDVNALQAALSELVVAGLITADAEANAVRVKITYEPAAAGVKALKKLGGQVAAAIEACEHPSARPRAVRVTSGGAR